MKNNIKTYTHTYVLPHTLSLLGDFTQKEAILHRGTSSEETKPNFLTVDQQFQIIVAIFQNCYSVKIDGKKELLLDIGSGQVQYIERNYKNFATIIKTAFRKISDSDGFEGINLPKLFEIIKSKPTYNSFTIATSIFFTENRFVIDEENNALIQENKINYDFDIKDISKTEYKEIVAGINKHWRGYIPTILDHMIAGKYVSDKKNLWLLILAKSNFGKSKIFKWIEPFGGSSFVNFDDLSTKGINNKSPRDFLNKMCLVIDEVLSFSRSMFKIEDTLEVRPMRNHSVRVPINSRYLLSADGGTFNNEYQELQTTNRVAVIDLRNDSSLDLGDLQVTKKHGRQKIKLVMTHYLYTEMKKRLIEYEKMNHIDRANKADNIIESIFNKFRMDKLDFFQIIERSVYEILENPKEALDNFSYSKLNDALVKVKNSKYDGWIIKRPHDTFYMMLLNYNSELKYELEFKKLNQIESNIKGFKQVNPTINGKKQRGLYIPRKIEPQKAESYPIQYEDTNGNIIKTEVSKPISQPDIFNQGNKEQIF